MTGHFMATRMLYSMVAPREITYERFLLGMDASLRRSLTPGYLMDFIHSKTGTALPQWVPAFLPAPLGVFQLVECSVATSLRLCQQTCSCT